MRVMGFVKGVLTLTSIILAIVAVIYVSTFYTPKGGVELSTTTISVPATTSTTATSTTGTSTTLILEHASATTTTSSSTTSTSTTQTTVSTLPGYLQKYSGRGYHQAYMKITFFCPSCVPAVVANFMITPGIISKDIGYRQNVSWGIYDPKKVSLDKVLMIAGGNGEVTLISDKEI